MKKIDYEKLSQILKFHLIKSINRKDEQTKKAIDELIKDTANNLHVDKEKFLQACGLK